MKALITGGAGFIGSHLAEELLKQGHQVTIIDDLSTGQFENIAHLTENDKFRFAIDTVTNEVVMDRLASESDTIFHMAAAVGVKLIVENPVRTIETNIMGTEAVLKAALRYRAKVIIASTSEVYGKGNSIPFREDDDVVIGPTCHNRWAYAASKMVDEFAALAYFREKGLPVVICRFFNTVGPRQTGRYGMVVPRFIQQALQGKPLTVYGDGNQARCFADVTDVVRAVITLAKSSEAVGQVLNVGSTEEVTILTLARKVLDLVHNGSRLSAVDHSETPVDGMPLAENADIVFIDYEHAYGLGFQDMMRRVPDISKVNDIIGWKPQITLEETLQRVIAISDSRGALNGTY
jgi:UDP-glucose 4-epimerase